MTNTTLPKKVCGENLGPESNHNLNPCTQKEKESKGEREKRERRTEREKLNAVQSELKNKTYSSINVRDI